MLRRNASSSLGPQKIVASLASRPLARMVRTPRKPWISPWASTPSPMTLAVQDWLWMHLEPHENANGRPYCLRSQSFLWSGSDSAGRFIVGDGGLFNHDNNQARLILNVGNVDVTGGTASRVNPTD